MRRVVNRPHSKDSRPRLVSLDRVRTVTLTLVLLLLIGHAVSPKTVTLDSSSGLLIIVASLLVLAPTLISAKLPGGTEFQFRQKIEAAEHLGSHVQRRLY